MATVIDRLKIKGSPAPRNSPVSPLMATCKANRPIPSTLISLDKSYEFVMRSASKSTMDIAFHMNAASRRMNYLNRLQHANFGITSMESSALINSEYHTCDEKPNFVLCGQPVNGVSPKTFNNYFREERVGNYKTSAHEVLRVRQKASKARSEPPSRTGRENSFEKETDIKNRHEIKSGEQKAPKSAPPKENRNKVTKNSSSSTNNNALELQGHNFKGCSPEGWSSRDNRVYYGDLKVSKSAGPVTRREATHESIKSHVTSIDLQSCMYVNSSTPRSMTSGAGSQNSAYVKRGMGIHNNPYRTLKGRDKKALLGEGTFDLKSLKQMANNLESPRSFTNEKYVEMPKSILKVPSQCTDTFLLHMMLELNRPLSRDSKVSGKYSDIALQRDLDEYMVVRSPSSNSQARSSPTKSLAQKYVKNNLDDLEARSSPVKSLAQKSVKSNLDDLEEESTCLGNDLEDDIR